MSTPAEKPHIDAPQADRLDLVRRTLEAIRAGAVGSSEVATAAQVAPRYGLYCLQAARQLGLIVESDEEKSVVSDRGGWASPDLMDNFLKQPVILEGQASLSRQA